MPHILQDAGTDVWDKMARQLIREERENDFSSILSQ